jgi:hypothetical protein
VVPSPARSLARVRRCTWLDVPRPPCGRWPRISPRPAGRRRSRSRRCAGNSPLSSARGIRVVTLGTGGLPETIPSDYPEAEKLRRWLVDRTLTGQAATLDDVGNLAAFVASDVARPVVGTVNMSAGAMLD